MTQRAANGAHHLFVRLALVDSRLSNGDTLTETLQDTCGITVRHDKPVPGLFDPVYVPLPIEPANAASDAHA
jgi:hypothetical protein